MKWILIDLKFHPNYLYIFIKVRFLFFFFNLLVFKRGKKIEKKISQGCENPGIWKKVETPPMICNDATNWVDKDKKGKQHKSDQIVPSVLFSLSPRHFQELWSKIKCTTFFQGIQHVFIFWHTHTQIYIIIGILIMNAFIR